MHDEILHAMMFLADQTHFEESPKSTNGQRQFETEEMLNPDHETIRELQEILDTKISFFNAGPKGKHLVIFHKEPITHRPDRVGIQQSWIHW